MEREAIPFHILIGNIIGVFESLTRIHTTIDILCGELSWQGFSCYK